MNNYPVLYSYRRCPYAMRARMGIYLAGLKVEQREIVFWDKPTAMLEVSAKGTVPVLILEDGQVLDESRDILLWALKQSESFLLPVNPSELKILEEWINGNDGDFKCWLDQYKYAERFPEKSAEYYRSQGELFLQKIEVALDDNSWLLGKNLSMADIAVFPFVRQFVSVDKDWFSMADYPNLKVWLKAHLTANYFTQIMKNRPVWQKHHQPLWVDEPLLETKDQFSKQALAERF